MSAPPHIAVILNAAAGNGSTQPLASSLAEKFLVHGWQARITLARSGEEILAAAQLAIDEGVHVVVAGGGDGTINAVASVVVGSRSALGVLPLGTLNHFARDLNIPLDLDEAVRVIAEGHTGKVDTGKVNGKLFLNNSSLGLYPDTVRHREQQQRRLGRGKWLAFFWATVTVLKRYPFLNATITLNGQAYHRRTPFIFIGNNPYQMEGFNIGARDRLDTGLLSLYVVQRTGRLGLLLLAARALLGKLSQAKDFDALTTEKLVINTHHAQLRVATDGEVLFMQTPLHYQICPGALTVIMPAPHRSTP